MATTSLTRAGKVYTLNEEQMRWEGEPGTTLDLLNHNWLYILARDPGVTTPDKYRVAVDALGEMYGAPIKGRPSTMGPACLPVGEPVTKHGTHNQLSHGRRGGGGSFRQFTTEEGAAWHEQHQAWAEALPEDVSDVVKDYASFGYGDTNAVLRGYEITKSGERDLTPSEKTELDKLLAGAPDRKTPNEWGLAPGESLNPTSMKISTRVPDTERMDRARKNADDLSRAIDEHGIVTKEGIEVTRGVFRPDATVEEMRASVGRTIEDRAFVSTSLGDTNFTRTDGYAGYARMEHTYKAVERATGMSPKTEDYLASKGVALRTRIQIPPGSKVMPVEAVRRYSGRTKRETQEAEILIKPGSKFRVKSFTENVGKDVANLTGATLTTPIHEVVLELVP